LGIANPTLILNNFGVKEWTAKKERIKMSEQIYNPNKLTAELQAANLPVASVSSSGRIDYSRELTASEKRTAKTVTEAHDLTPLTKDLRQEAYRSAGITNDDLLFALWDQIIKGDSTGAVALQAKMEAIDLKIN
jgi:hypothetical protein